MKRIIVVSLSILVLCASAVFAQEEKKPAKKSAAKQASAVVAKKKAEKVATKSAEAALAAATAAASGRPKVVFNPKINRDPTLSPDDILLLESRRKAAEAAKEAERRRKEEEERRRIEEEKRLRELELLRLKDPSREVRNKISIGGIIDQEVFIGDKIYTVGNSIYGATITEVRPDGVVFSYKGHTFVKKIPI